MIRFLGAAALLLYASYSAAAQQPTVQSVAGLWAGESYQPALQMHTTWLMHRKDDGSFRVEFRGYRDCLLMLRQVEEGRWRQDGLQYLTTTNSIDGEAFAADDEYRIDEISSMTMRYTHLKSGTKFEVRRVSDQADFPVPAKCSI